MNARLQELIESPGSPNLYWALAGLPQPLIDLRPAMEFELYTPLQVFPFLADAEQAERAPEEWRRLLAEVMPMLRQIEGATGGTAFGDSLLTASLVVKAYPHAKRELLQAGYADEQVEAMPVAQVVVIQAARGHRHIADEYLKWTRVPYPQSHERLGRVIDELRRNGYMNGPGSREVLPIAQLVLPATANAMAAELRLARRIAALQTIEAIRMYAAAHDGSLPPRLEDIAEAPPPVDPRTGKLFPYRIEEDRAVLDEGPYDRVTNGKLFEIVLK
jgi:hypothetical protein